MDAQTPTPTQTIPTLSLFGAGAHPSTKAQRRAARFKRGAFRIGEVSVRTNRRTAVSLEFIRLHFTTICDKIREGVLRVESATDTFVDPDELRALLDGAMISGEDPATGTDENTDSEDDDGDEGEDTGTDEGGENEGSQESDELEPTEGAQAPAEADAAVDAPPEEPETVMAPAEAPPAPTKKALPDAWRARNKKGLLDLCRELGVEANDKMNNATIIGHIEDWEKANG